MQKLQKIQRVHTLRWDDLTDKIINIAIIYKFIGSFIKDLPEILTDAFYEYDTCLKQRNQRTQICVCVCVCIYICMYVCMYVCIYVYIYVYVCMYVCVYIYKSW